MDSVLGQAASIRLHAWSPSQWTLNFVPSVYRSGIPMGNQTPIKEPQDLCLDSLLPKQYANYSVTEHSRKFHYVYRDMTTGLLINIHSLSSLVTHESWVNFDRISLLPCPD